MLSKGHILIFVELNFLPYESDFATLEYVGDTIFNYYATMETA